MRPCFVWERVQKQTLGVKQIHNKQRSAEYYRSIHTKIKKLQSYGDQYLQSQLAAFRTLASLRICKLPFSKQLMLSASFHIDRINLCQEKKTKQKKKSEQLLLKESSVYLFEERYARKEGLRNCHQYQWQ